MGQQALHLEKRITKTVELDYLLYLPPDYEQDAEQKWPLILFLHGAGERGDDLEQLKKQGIPKIIEQGGDFPFVIVSPQCPQDTMWTEKFDALDALLQEVEENYAIAPDRVYLTGLSMGGYGSWHMAALYPKRFAAVVPICGGAIPMVGFPDRIRVIKDVPVWAFHGAEDQVVPLEESQKLVDFATEMWFLYPLTFPLVGAIIRLKEVGGNVRLTIYPEAGHDAWTQAYANPELYEWLLQQKRRSE